ncbi:MAG: hypothetical protein RJA98_906, partial [Pseudomonadota bacterium]
MDLSPPAGGVRAARLSDADLGKNFCDAHAPL